nr:MAG TPA: hypothetical protein [Bacteriophage sp.]
MYDIIQSQSSKRQPDERRTATANRLPQAD